MSSGGIEEWGALCRDEEGPGMVPGGIKPELVELYKEVGKILRRFTTGKVPKAFKIIPKLENWEDVSILDHFTAFSLPLLSHGVSESSTWS